MAISLIKSEIQKFWYSIELELCTISHIFRTNAVSILCVCYKLPVCDDT